MLTTRTEYYGEFHNTLRKYKANFLRVDDYFLEELNEEKLVRAIEQPTSLDDYDEDSGSPRTQYKFHYEQDLPKMIAQDTIKTMPAGGILPSMQIVCTRLYNATKESAEGEEWIITKDDYKRLGRVEGQITAYLDDVLKDFCRKNGIKSPEIQFEVSRWKNIFKMLIKPQVDGSVTTDIKTQDQLYNASVTQGCILDFKLVMNFLTDDRQRIIRKSEVVNIETDLSLTCYSLGHDAIGLALKNYTPPKEVIKTKPKVFICYAKEDMQIAKRLYQDIKREGIAVWLDVEELLPGDSWKIDMKKAIKDSSYFLALLSSNSIGKRGYVQNELKIALDLLDETSDYNNFILPVRINSCMPETDKLKELQWVDLFPSYEAGLEKILRSLAPGKKKQIIENTIAKIKGFDDTNYLSRRIVLYDNYKPELLLSFDRHSQDIISVITEHKSYVFTNQSLQKLKKEGLPDDVLKKLEIFNYKEVKEENEFIDALKKTIGDKQTVSYKAAILKHSAKQNRIALLGDAGSGKTTTLKMIAWYLSKEDTPFYPLFISLNQYNQDRSLFQQLPSNLNEVPEKKLLFILDGLDEIESQYRSDAIHEIEWLADKFPLSQIIVSCRTNFYQTGKKQSSATLKDFTAYILLELEGNEINNYIEKNLHKWTDSFYQEIKVHQLYDLLKIPFYLIHLVEIFKKGELPKNKSKIFEGMLFEPRQFDTQRFKTTVDFQTQQHYIIGTLERLALSMETLCRNYITHDELNQLIPDKKSREIIQYCTLWNATKLQFEHNNFQEYLAARILSKKPLEIIKDFVSFEPEHKKTIPSWLNTLSFILNISDDQSLFDWIMDIEPEIAVKFEPNRIELSKRVEIFKKIFNDYKKKKIWIDNDRFNFSELGRFGQSDDIIAFLLSEAEEKAAHYTTLDNAIRLLSYMQIPSNYTQRITQILVNTALNKNISPIIVKDALHALAELKLNTKEVTNKVISVLHSSNNDWIRYGLYYFLYHSDYIDEYIDIFLEGIKYIRFHLSENRGRLIDEQMHLLLGLGKAQSTLAIKKILNYFEKNIRDLDEVFIGDLDFSAIAENASNAYFNEPSIFENVFNISRSMIENHSFVKPILLFYEKTSTSFQAFQKLLLEIKIDNAFFLADLANVESINYFVAEYEKGNIPDNGVWSFLNSLSQKNIELFNFLSKLINEKSNNKFIPPPKIDYEKQRKERKQFDFNLLFDKQAFFNEIKRIFDVMQKQNLTYDELEDISFNLSLKNSYSDLAINELRHIIDKYIEEQSVSYEQVAQVIDRWDWDWFCISKTYKSLSTEQIKLITLSPTQKKWIADRCCSMIDKVNFKTALTQKENSISFRPDAMYLMFFLIEFDLNFSEKVLLDMLSFAHYENEFAYLESRLNSNDVTLRVMENLKEGISVDFVLKNHIDYCKRHRIKEGVKFAIPIITSPDRDHNIKKSALELISELSDDLSELENVLRDIKDDFKWNVIDQLIKNKSTSVHQFLSEYFLISEDKDKFKAVTYLVKLQDLDALRYYVDWIKKENKFTTRLYDTSPLPSLKTLQSVPMLIELLELSYHEDFEQEKNFGHLDQIVLNSLTSIALQSDHNYTQIKQIIEAFINKFSLRYTNVNWLNSFLDRLEHKYYINKSEHLTLKDVINKLQKIGII